MTESRAVSFQHHSESPLISPAVSICPEVKNGPGSNTARGRPDTGPRQRLETGTLSLQMALLPGPDTHTPLPPVDKADGIDTKFSFITSSSKSSIGYSFRCSEGTKGEKGRGRQVR